MIKIVIFNTHFAWIDNQMIEKLDEYLKVQSKLRQEELNRSMWVREECEEHLNIKVNSKEDVKKINERLKELYYSNKAEWLRERIRQRININS